MSVYGGGEAGVRGGARWRARSGAGRLLRRVVAILSGVAVVTTCSGEGPGPSGPPEPDAGTMEIRIPVAASATGILVLELTGARSGPIDGVGPGEVWASQASSSARIRLLVEGPDLPGPVARFTSPDRDGAYSVRVLEAASDASGGYAVLDPADFTVAIAPVN